MKKYILLTIILTLITNSGCGPYSFTGRSDPGFSRVAINIFENRTGEFQISEKIQNSLVNKFLDENVFEITSQNNAEAVLSGTIVSVSDQPRSLDNKELAEETELTITVGIVLSDKQSGKQLIQQQFRGLALYKDITDREDSIDEALEQIVEDIANRILSDW